MKNSNRCFLLTEWDLVNEVLDSPQGPAFSFIPADPELTGDVHEMTLMNLSEGYLRNLLD